MKTYTLRFIVIMVCAFLAGDLYAQLDKSAFVSTTSTALSTSNYYFAKPNEITITVSVIGNVVRPGRYEISKSIDLMNLVSLAGGPSPEGTISDVKIQRINETASGPRFESLTLDLEDPEGLGPSDLKLSPGDVIYVGQSGWISFKDAFTIVVGAAVIVTAIAYVQIAWGD